MTNDIVRRTLDASLIRRNRFFKPTSIPEGMAEIYKSKGISIGVESDCFLEQRNGFLWPACCEQGRSICMIGTRPAGIESHSAFPFGNRLVIFPSSQIYNSQHF